MLSVLPKIAISEVSDSVNFSGGILRSGFILNEFVSSVVVSEIFAATSVTRARADVAYCIHALSRRLHKTRTWTVLIDYYSLLCFLITWVASTGCFENTNCDTSASKGRRSNFQRGTIEFFAERADFATF